MEEDEDSHSRLLVTKIRESYDDPAYSDIKVKSEGKVYAHKIILSTRGRGVLELRNQQILDLSCLEDKVSSSGLIMELFCVQLRFRRKT